MVVGPLAGDDVIRAVREDTINDDDGGGRNDTMGLASSAKRTEPPEDETRIGPVRRCDDPR